jgi:phage tail-like protein
MMPETGAIVDPYRRYNFKLIGFNEAYGMAHFSACIGLGVNIEVIRYRENAGVMRMLPGLPDYEPVTLFYGLTRDNALFNWLTDMASGKITRANPSILLLDTQGTQEVMRWNLINAWPAKWSGIELDSLSGEVAIEKLTLVYERLERSLGTTGGDGGKKS